MIYLYFYLLIFQGGTQVSKLDKADILEMTVSHLRQIHHQQLAVAMATSASVVKQYQEGFSECASETVRYLATTQGPVGMTARVQHHLTTKVRQLTNYNNTDKMVPGGNLQHGQIKIEIPKPQHATPAHSDSTMMNQSSLLMPVRVIKQEKMSDFSPEVSKSTGHTSPQPSVLSLPSCVPISVAESPSQKAVWRPF